MNVCLRLGCLAEATHTLIPQYGRASLWCLEHGELALETHQLFDNRQVAGSRLLPENRLALPRPHEEAVAEL